MCASSRCASSMTSSTEPPVRHLSSQSDDSEYSLTRPNGPSAHSRISLNAPLVMTMALSRSAGLATECWYDEGWRANNCGLTAATIFTLMPLAASDGSRFTRFRVGMVPRMKTVPPRGSPGW